MGKNSTVFGRPFVAVGLRMSSSTLLHKVFRRLSLKVAVVVAAATH
jgi:hypothetical protein